MFSYLSTMTFFQRAPQPRFEADCGFFCEKTNEVLKPKPAPSNCVLQANFVSLLTHVLRKLSSLEQTQRDIRTKIYDTDSKVDRVLENLNQASHELASPTDDEFPRLATGSTGFEDVVERLECSNVVQNGLVDKLSELETKTANGLMKLNDVNARAFESVAKIQEIQYREKELFESVRSTEQTLKGAAESVYSSRQRLSEFTTAVEGIVNKASSLEGIVNKASSLEEASRLLSNKTERQLGDMSDVTKKLQAEVKMMTDRSNAAVGALAQSQKCSKALEDSGRKLISTLTATQEHLVKARTSDLKAVVKPMLEEACQMTSQGLKQTEKSLMSSLSGLVVQQLSKSADQAADRTCQAITKYVDFKELQNAVLVNGQYMGTYLLPAVQFQGEAVHALNQMMKPLTILPSKQQNLKLDIIRMMEKEGQLIRDTITKKPVSDSFTFEMILPSVDKLFSSGAIENSLPWFLPHFDSSVKGRVHFSRNGQVEIGLVCGRRSKSVGLREKRIGPMSCCIQMIKQYVDSPPASEALSSDEPRNLNPNDTTSADDGPTDSDDQSLSDQILSGTPRVLESVWVLKEDVVCLDEAREPMTRGQSGSQRRPWVAVSSKELNYLGFVVNNSLLIRFDINVL